MSSSSSSSNMLVGQFQVYAANLMNNSIINDSRHSLVSNNSNAFTHRLPSLATIQPISRPFNCNQSNRQSISPSNSSNDSCYSSYNLSPQSLTIERLTYNDIKQKKLPLRSEKVNLNELIMNAKTHSNKNIYCAFCKSNGESREIFTSHSLKDINGKTTCPILKQHKCPVCNATGEQSHTITYCKQFKQLKLLQSIQKESLNF